ncbi:hypothetical protein [Pseudomonas yangonensis]|uniref:hypothetical protein n=1 Tax=Pseudomonas yangonensis TaxID=2579922 RepID=UPI00137A1258|nr:hypothetical protein [Pseudomonas yangonensis]
MRKRLVKCIFTILLFAGVIGLYLAFYGPFKISLIGFSIAAIIAGIIVYLDISLKGNTYNIHDKLSAPNLIICTFLYLTFSGWALVRTGHEVISERQIHTGLFSSHVSGSYRAKPCRRSITALEPIEFTGLKLCLSHENYSTTISNAKIDRRTYLRRIVFGLDVSPLGKTIFLPKQQ